MQCPHAPSGRGADGLNVSKRDAASGYTISLHWRVAPHVMVGVLSTYSLSSFGRVHELASFLRERGTPRPRPATTSAFIRSLRTLAPAAPPSILAKRGPIRAPLRVSRIIVRNRCPDGRRARDRIRRGPFTDSPCSGREELSNANCAIPKSVAVIPQLRPQRRLARHKIGCRDLRNVYAFFTHSRTQRQGDTCKSRNSDTWFSSSQT